MIAQDTPLARLARVASHSPDRLAFCFLRDGATPAAQLSYGELNRRAAEVAGALLERVAPGDRVLLPLKPGPAFPIALFGCWRAGVVPVPAYPPRPNRPNDRALIIARDAGAQLALLLDAERSDTRRAFEAAGMEWLDIGGLSAGATEPPWFDWPADALHLLQYTSGSTSEPKGVAISVAALTANLDAINERLHGDWAGANVSWLPHFHDFGLIQANIQTIWRGDAAYLLNPTDFIKHPLAWLQAMSRYRATETQAPNFAFELVVASAKPGDLDGIDLSSLKNVIAGAEPIRKGVMERFLALAQPLGLNPGAVVHGYGMAETTLGASAHRGPGGYRSLDAAALAKGRAAPAEAGAPSREVACCGFPLQGFAASIVDPATQARLPADVIGEICFAGPSLASGYWRRPELTAETFGAMTRDGAGPFLRTGDLGFLDADGRLFVTGRLKDLIIVHGRNHYPQDIESTARAAHSHLAELRGAAFAVDDGAKDAVVVAHEVRRDATLATDAVIDAIRRAVAEEHGVNLDAVALVRAGTLPVTSSNKIQRRAAQKAWRDGQLVVVAEWRRETADDRTSSAQNPDARVIERLIGFAAELSGQAPASIDPQEPLAMLGFGSLEGARLIGQIEAAFGISVDPTIAYTHPTIQQLAELVIERTRRVAEAAIATALANLPAAAPEKGLAIVGMACRFPGAPNLEAFWRLVAEGRRAIAPAPAQRTDLASSFAGASATTPRRGGFLADVAEFDPGFFKMAPAEAALLDPQHRLFLEVAWEALETLADAPDHWAGRKVGVFVGLSQVDYLMMLAGAGQISAAHAPTGNAHNMAANRLSYLLDFKGPSLAIDTACSSSLVALAMAKRSLDAGECDMAIVGGCNLTLDGRVTEAFHRAGMLAPDGTCKSFDATADGYGRGEGCGVVVLKRAADARVAGDHVYALVSGVAVNQNGLSNGLTAPNGAAQEELIGAALAAAGIAGSEIAYVEAHGTGTRLGDPVEANALAGALGAPADRRWIGAVKANIGHLEAAAGVAGLIKAALVLDRRIVPPIAGLNDPNPLIAKASQFFELPRQAAPLPATARYAGISAFGFGGANAHAILQTASAPAAPDARAPLGLATLCLSARDEGGLRDVAAAWRDLLRSDPQRPASVFAANALRRRAALRRRLAVTGRDALELAAALDQWLAGAPSDGADRRTTIAATWMAGGRPEWRLAWNDAPLPLLDLPSYPFQRQRCWAIETAGPIAAAPASAGQGAAPTAIAAAGTIEERLSTFIAALLGLDPGKLDRTERFIEMGADSIVMASALREVERQFGVTITFRQILEDTPTIATLAAHIASVAPATTPTPVSSGTAGALDEALSAAERTMAILLEQQQRLRSLVAGATPGGVDIPAALRGASDPRALSAGTAPAAQTPEFASAKLAALAARYTARTAKSKQRAAEARAGLADARASAGFRGSIKEMLYPLAGDSASGAYMTDIDGNQYVDLAMGFGVLLFGHAPEFVLRALTQELARGMPLGPQSRIAGEVAELLRQLTGAERVGFASTGTEAVMTALRLARAVTGRRKVVIFEGAYHGHFDGVLGVARETSNRLETAPLAPGVAPSAIADLVVLPYDSDRSLDILRSMGDQIAAILVEPVQSRRPDLQPRAFLHSLRALCDDNGAALIFDEMITGFRIGGGGAQAHFDVRADLVTYGKILGGGMPIGAIAGRRRFLDALDGGYWNFGDASAPTTPATFFAGTYNKHPMAMAAAHAVLTQIAAEGPALYAQLNANADSLHARLEPILARAHLGLARFGSMFRFTHVGNADAFFFGLLERGLYLWEGRTCFLSTAHGPAELDRIVAAVAATVDDITDRGPVAAPARTNSASRQLLLLADLSPGAWRAYQEAAAVRLATGTDAAKVEAALDRLAERRPMLKRGAAVLKRLRLDARTSLRDTLARARAEPLERGGAPWRAFLVEGDAEPVLMLVAHHAYVDGASLGLLIEEILQLMEGRELPAPPSPIAAAASSAARTENARWWRDKLSALPPTPAAPAERPRPAIASFAGDCVERRLDAELWNAVRRAATEASATPNMVLAAAWSAALHRITGANRLTLGIAASGRDSVETAGVIGNFAQLLPIESRLDAQESLADHFKGVRNALLEAYERQDVDMAGVLETLARPFDPARPAAFPFAFNFDPGSSRIAVSTPTTHAKFELALNLTQDGDGVIARLDFATDLFGAKTAAVWLDGFCALLAGLCQTPQHRPADLWRSEPLLGGAGATRHASLPEWLAASAAARADAVAIEFRGERTSYRGLAARAGALAAAIVARATGREGRIAVALTPSADLPAALWAIHWADAAYVPIDPTHPIGYLRRILGETGAALILTEAAHQEALAPLGVPLLLVESVEDLAPPPPAALASDRLAYLLYSSGSTGNSKCIAVSHGALVNHLESMAQTPGAGAEDRLLALTPLTFDIAALELFLPLVVGGVLAIAPAATRGDAPALTQQIAAARPTLLQATPSLLTLLTEVGWRPEAATKVLVGGEKLPERLAATLTQQGAEVWNMYGPTETTIWSSCARVRADAPIELGSPIQATSLTVLDAAGDPVAPGAIGEIAIGGAGLARGYWGRPDLTAERFLPGPDGARLYRTGDLARLDVEGRLRFIGRRDDQVKIAGHRIELDAVAAGIEALPDVARAVAFVETTGGGARLAACVQPAVGAALSVAGLRSELERAAPPQMRPARLLIVDRVPMTANGKIDRRALAAIEPAEVSAAPPATEREARIAAIWRSVLGLDRLDHEASFFELGGASMMLAQMHLRVVKEFSVDFPLVDCVRFPTVRGLARHLGEMSAPAANGEIAQAIQRGRDRSEKLRRLAAGINVNLKTNTNDMGGDHA